MSLVNFETGELVEVMDADEARRLTERIRIAATNYTEAKDKVIRLVDEAEAGQAHVALGYRSWSDYLSDVLSDEPLRLARDERPELASRLADKGMSNVAIGKVLGVSDMTVARDLAIAPSTNVEGDRVSRRNRERLTKRIYLSLIYRAWNARQAGKTMRFIRVNSPAGGLVPIPEPR